jgi:hypothetical protein
VLFDVPHAALCIYHKWYVKSGGCPSDDCPATHNEAVEKLFSCPHSAVNQMEWQCGQASGRSPVFDKSRRCRDGDL